MLATLDVKPRIRVAASPSWFWDVPSFTRSANT